MRKRTLLFLAAFVLAAFVLQGCQDRVDEREARGYADSDHPDFEDDDPPREAAPVEGRDARGAVIGHPAAT